MRFSTFFHDRSRELKIPPEDSSLWPDEWTTVVYKEYVGATRYSLPKEGVQSGTEESLRSALLTRKTHRLYEQRDTLRADTLGTLLWLACGEARIAENGRPYRTYPSAGGFYSIETYVYLKDALDHLPQGAYHYRCDLHALERIAVSGGEGEQNPVGVPWAKEAPVTIYFTCIFDRGAEKYGERAYRYALLEAGSMSQNMHLVATTLGLRSASIGGVFEHTAEEMLGIDGVTEAVVHTIVMG